MWWRKKISLFSVAQSQLKDRLATISGRVQQKFAGYLQRQDAKLSVRQRKLCFAVFLLAGCGASGFIVVDTFYGQKHTDAMISTPTHVMPFRQELQTPKFSRNDTINIRSFRQVLDSLQSTPAGRQLLKEHFRDRPGLIDSFEVLEKMFR